MSENDRRRALELMRDALMLLDVAGEQRASLHLQLALDLLDEEPNTAGTLVPPTCH